MVTTNETDVLCHYDYVDGQCVNEEMCIDKGALIAIPSLDREKGANLIKDEYLLSTVRRKGSGFPFLFGCILSADDHTEPPAFENPDILYITNGPDGRMPNGNNYNAVLNEDGRFTAYQSFASNLVDNDKNKVSDIFVYDRQENTTERVSVSSEGKEANGYSLLPSISADGRFVAFTSLADNLVPNDRNNMTDIFVYDRQEKKTDWVSISYNGEEANSDSYTSSISADGKYVAFNGGATNLAPPCTNGLDSVFIHDRQTKKIACASVDDIDWQTNGNCGTPSISGDGGLVVFGSWASNLVKPKDENGFYDVFLKNMANGAAKMISTGPLGGPANGNSSTPSISADGKTAVFLSQATDLTSSSDSKWWKIFTLDIENSVFKNCSDIIVYKKYSDKSDYYHLAKNLPTISADGRFVAFDATEELTPDDTNDATDIFVCDTKNGAIERISKAKDGGKEVNDGSYSPDISGDGRFIAFSTSSIGAKIYVDVFVAKNPLFSE